MEINIRPQLLAAIRAKALARGVTLTSEEEDAIIRRACERFNESLRRVNVNPV